MAFDEFDYERKWTEPNDFPTYEYDEGTVRADMQALFDEIRDAFNGFATQADADITQLQGAIDDIEAGQVPDGSIVSDKLAPNSVTSAHIVNGTIKSEDIMDGTIEAKKLAEKSVPGSGIAGVTSRIRAGSIAATDIKNKTITPAKLADGGEGTGIPGSGIAGVVSKIRKKSIGPEDLVDGGVARGIPGSGLSPIVQSKIWESSIGTNDITPLAITTELIEDNAVTADKIYAPGLVEILSTPEYQIGADQIAFYVVSLGLHATVRRSDWRQQSGGTWWYADVEIQGNVDEGISIMDNYILDLLVSTNRPVSEAEAALEAYSHIYRALVTLDPEDEESCVLRLYSDERINTTLGLTLLRIKG